MATVVAVAAVVQAVEVGLVRSSRLYSIGFLVSGDAREIAHWRVAIASKLVPPKLA